MPFEYANVEMVLAKDKNIKMNDVRALQEWVEKQPHLPKISDLQAVLFIQSCYYRIEKAKAALDNFFTVRTMCPEIFYFNLEDPAIKMSMNTVLFSILPERTPEGYMVIFTHLMDTNPEHYHYVASNRLFDMLTLSNIHKYGPCNGIAVVMDTDGATLGHLAKMSLSAAKKLLYYLQEAMPIRLKIIHVINVVPFMDKIMMLVKPFMKKEMIEMMNFHTENLDAMYKSVPKECLPKELGGEAGSYKQLQERVNKDLVSNADFYDFLNKQRVDESKRQGKSQSADMFGMDGSFKKLDID